MALRTVLGIKIRDHKRPLLIFIFLLDL